MTFVDVDRPPLVPRLEKFEAAQRVMSMQEQQQLKKLSSAQQQQEDQLQSKTVAATTHSLENSTSASAQDSENMTASNTVAMGQSQQQTPAVVKAPTLSRTKRPVMRPSQVDKKHQQMRLQHRMLQQQHRDSLDRASLFFMRDSARLSAVANNHYNNNNINNVVKNNLYSSRHPAVEEDSCVLDACPSLPSTPQATSPRSPHEYQEQQCQEQNNSAKYNSSASNYDDLASAQKLIQGLRLDNKMPASSAATIMANGMPTAATNNSDTFTPAGHKRPRSLNSSFAPGSIAAANADVFVDNNNSNSNNMNNNNGRGLTSSPDFAPLSVSSTTLDPDAKTTVAYDGVRAKATTPAANASGIAGTTRKRARLVRRDARSAPCSWNTAEQQATVRFLQCLQTKFRHIPKTDIDSPTSVSSGEDSSSSSTRSHASDASDDYHQVARLQHSYAQHIEN